MAGKINIISYNCRSIYSCLSEIKIFIYSRKPHCICLNETWIFNNIYPNFINYKPYWKNRPEGRGGGLAILVRSDLVVIPSQFTYYESDLEVQKITLKLLNNNIDILNI